MRLQFPTFNAAIEAAGLAPRPAPSRHRTNLSGPAAITDAMIEWTRRYGDLPAMADWDPVRARRLWTGLVRYNQGDWPSARSVALHFGSFANAATAAGLMPRERSIGHKQRRDRQAANRSRGLGWGQLVRTRHGGMVGWSQRICQCEDPGRRLPSAAKLLNVRYGRGAHLVRMKAMYARKSPRITPAIDKMNSASGLRCIQDHLLSLR